MRLFKRILFCSLLLIALVAGLFVGLVAFASVEKQDGFFLEGTELSECNYLHDLDAKVRGDPFNYLGNDNLSPVFAHRLKRGQGTIFGYRWFFPGNLGVTDTQQYLKLTIWVAPGTVLKSVTIDLNDRTKVIALSTGGSVWPQWSLQNRPLVVTAKPANGERPRQGCFNLLPPGGASPFWFSNYADRILGHDRGAASDRAWRRPQRCHRVAFPNPPPDGSTSSRCCPVHSDA
jgi:hypothetical protein